MLPNSLHVNPTIFTSLPPLHRRHHHHRRNYNSSQVIPKAISISSTPSNGIIHSETTPYEDEVAAFWDYQFLFISQRTETTQPITLKLVNGVVPSDFPIGTYYLAGPGLFSDDHGSTVHPLDGHGYVKSFRIVEESGHGRKVVYMAKYVKTEAQMEEHDPVTDTWRFTHRGPFSLLKGGKIVGNTKVMKNVANTSVLRWGGRLLCLWEGGDPYEIHPRTLDTVGRFGLIDNQLVAGPGDVWDFAAGLLKPVLYGLFRMPPKRLLSHYKVDNKRDRLLTMSCNAEDMLMPRNNFTFYEYDANFKLLQSQEFPIPDQLMIHDWAFTDTHYILFGNRIKIDAFGAILAVCGLSPMISTLSVNPSSTSPIYLLPRFPSHESSSQRDWRVPVEAQLPMWLNHVGNAFQSIDEDGNSKIHIHAATCSYEWFNFHKLFGYNWRSGKLDPSAMNFTKESDYQLLPHLVEITINLGAHGSYEKCDIEPLNKWNKATDFPIINPAFSGEKHRYIYAAACSGSRRTLPNFPFDTVVKMDGKEKSVSTWTARRRTFIGEPIFVPKCSNSSDMGEDDGYLLVVEYAVAIQKCYLVILDPKMIGEGDCAVVARLEVPKELNFPLAFHGFWASDPK
ncbi:Carotenoid cleavage dioxygenase 7, chloroplastic [Linum perenne]